MLLSLVGSTALHCCAGKSRCRSLSVGFCPCKCTDMASFLCILPALNGWVWCGRESLQGMMQGCKTGNDIAIVLKRFLLQLQVTGLGSAGTFWLLVAGAAPCSGRLVGTEVVPWIRSPVAPPVRHVRCVCVRTGLGGSALQLRRAEEGNPCHRLCARSCKFA